jgi:hypothetical protein
MYPFLFNADIVETTHQLTIKQLSQITHTVTFCTDPLRSSSRSSSGSNSSSSNSNSSSRDGTIDMINSMYLVLVNITISYAHRILTIQNPVKSSLHSLAVTWLDSSRNELCSVL